MTCPKCKSTRLGVMDFAHNHDANETYKKMKCTGCGKIFYTVEFEAAYDELFVKDWNKYYRSQRGST